METARWRKKKLKPTVRTAEEPGQTATVDLCFVPLTHQPEEKLPAVSGSSGKLVIQSSPGADKAPDYPGRVFEKEDLCYTAAMEAFVKASQEEEKVSSPPKLVDWKQMSLQEKKRRLLQEEVALRNERRTVRHKRAEADVATKAQRFGERQAWRSPNRRQQRKLQKRQPSLKTVPHRKASDAAWKTQRQQRKQTLDGESTKLCALTVVKRKPEDRLWREKRQEIKQRFSELPIITAWVAILVITDNCTRQCFGLPLFVAGAKVTAEVIIEARTQLLPTELKFLISDRGPQFRAKVFEQLAVGQSFIHVLIARHRPQSFGKAERFVRTLKEWLADRHWQDDHQLQH